MRTLALLTLLFISSVGYAPLIRSTGECEAKGICLGNCVFRVTEIVNRCLTDSWECPIKVKDEFLSEICGSSRNDCVKVGTKGVWRRKCLAKEPPYQDPPDEPRPITTVPLR